MLKCYDYQCPRCERIHANQLEEEGDSFFCGECGQEGHKITLERLMPGPKTLTTIVPTYPGSKALKAGHAHKFNNRPAEKTQIGFGGSVSKDHPTGGRKPQQ